MGALERPFYAPAIKSSMTSLQQISELTPTAATAHGANGLEAYSFDNSGDRHVATEKNGAGSLQLAQAAPSMAITSVTSRQRTSRQRAMIRLFPFKRLVNKTTSPYVSWNNKESSRLSGWLKLLSLLALVLMSAPTVASAHCEHDDEPATGWGYVAQNPNEERSVAADSSEHNRFFETSDRIPGGSCHGSCCCCQGMVHCGPSGCSLSALDGHNAAQVLDPQGKLLAFSENQLPPLLHCYSGLERPPKG